MGEKELHIVMYPWLAFGHMMPFLHLSNKLAENGHKITFLLPKKAKTQLQSLNRHPSLLTFRPITVPHVDPLPPGAETCSDVPFPLHTHLATAYDLTRRQFESIIAAVRPQIIIFDAAAYWVPEIATKLGGGGIKTVSYNVLSAATLAISFVPPDRKLPVTEEDVAAPPPGYPSSTIVLEPRKLFDAVTCPFGEGLTLYERISRSLKSADVIAIRTCRELEGKFCDYISSQYNKPVILSGPVLPEPDTSKELEARWGTWLAKFGVGSVVFCAFGSQFVPSVTQFQELLLGFEMTKMPFLVAIKPPEGCATMEEALPEGFLERVGERGVVTGEWVPQPLILNHPSIGCFVNHCGFGTMWESLLSEKQLVLVPQLGDQIMNAKMLAKEMKVGVEVERRNDGWVSKENLCDAINFVMSNNGILLKKNHVIWRQKFGHPQFMSDYLHNFIQELYALVEGCK